MDPLSAALVGFIWAAAVAAVILDRRAKQRHRDAYYRNHPRKRRG